MRRAAAPALIGAIAAAAIAIAAEGPGPSRQTDPFAALAARLSTGQLAGERVIASYAGAEPPKRLMKLIRKGRVAGVIFFEENVVSRERLAAVAARLQRASRRSSLPAAERLPLLLMTDQEGGQVRRLPGAPRRSQAQIGAARRAGRQASKAGRGAARNLARVGLNVNLAPVLDVVRTGGAIAQYGRSYGRNSAKVGRLGAKSIAAQQNAGVAATAKHFPGMGAAAVNTDDAGVEIGTSRSQLRQVDEAPYADALEAGVSLVMLANAIYPALDRVRPASLSGRVIGGELRRQAGFDGVAITDALEAAGLEAYGSVPKRGLRAARAGADLLLFSGRRIGDAARGWRRLAGAIRGGTLDRRQAVESARRVLALRERLG